MVPEWLAVGASFVLVVLPARRFINFLWSPSDSQVRNSPQGIAGILRELGLNAAIMAITLDVLRGWLAASWLLMDQPEPILWAWLTLIVIWIMCGMNIIFGWGIAWAVVPSCAHTLLVVWLVLRVVFRVESGIMVVIGLLLPVLMWFETKTIEFFIVSVGAAIALLMSYLGVKKQYIFENTFLKCSPFRYVANILVEEVSKKG